MKMKIYIFIRRRIVNKFELNNVFKIWKLVNRILKNKSLEGFLKIYNKVGIKVVQLILKKKKKSNVLN